MDTEKFIDKTIEFIKNVPDDERVDFAINLCTQVALWSGYNDVEILGIIEYAKLNLYTALENERMGKELDNQLETELKEHLKETGVVK